jgi:protein-tyrosine-phosphatase
VGKEQEGMKILFVCTGNICRSPMAAEYFRARAAQSGLSHVVVDSAGTAGLAGAPASPEAIAVMAEIGIDLSNHRSSGLAASDLQTSDYVLAMTRNQLEYIARHYPEGMDRRLLLRAFEETTDPDMGAGDLADPIGHPIDIYRKLLPIIVRCIDHFVLHLKHLS